MSRAPLRPVILPQSSRVLDAGSLTHLGTIKIPMRRWHRGHHSSTALSLSNLEGLAGQRMEPITEVHCG